MVEIRIAKKLMGANDEIASGVRDLLREKKITAVNVMGSPGSGKTTLLERLVAFSKGRWRVAVIEGDLETSRDAERMDRAGVRAVQVTTGKGCHLHAGMVQDALSALEPDALDLLYIENVGNLVCPSGFDLGEDFRIVVVSVTEGDDKAGKYPPMFARADLLVLNKIDLLPHVDFDVERFETEAQEIQPKVDLFRISCRTGEGVDALAAKVAAAVAGKKGAGPER